ncbi:hypothetical protein [Cupriavidus taiwanensis]|uniref:hypothetical protein n=1 Tax=Cupriavidus taiwanensis TaxID=164546 RepID=UPI001E3C53B3|nr:hypothetical protein [Cupriavidus taiwanensis]
MLQLLQGMSQFTARPQSRPEELHDETGKRQQQQSADAPVKHIGKQGKKIGRHERVKK